MYFNVPDDILELQTTALLAAARAGQIILVIGLAGAERKVLMCTNMTIAHRLVKLEANGQPYAVAAPDGLRLTSWPIPKED